MRGNRIRKLAAMIAAVSALGALGGAADAKPKDKPAKARGAGHPVFTHGVASGDVTSSQAILWTRTDRPSTIKVEVYPTPALKGRKAFQRTVRTSIEDDFTAKVDASGLEPGTTYFYRWRHGNTTSPVGTFVTAPDRGTRADVTFTYSGDSDGTRVNGEPFYGQFEVLDRAREENGDFFVYLGDTIYSDSGLRPAPATTLEEYREAYRINREIPALPSLLGSTSTYAQQDDHEVLNDYDGQTVDRARYAAGIEAFLEYMPIREEGLLQDPTCAGDPLFRAFEWGSEIDVIIPDERSCKSADVSSVCLGDLGPTLPESARLQFPFRLFLTPNPPPGCLEAIFDPSRTVLGPVQKEAFKRALLESTAKFKLVINEFPMQQFLALPYDRWEGYGAERNEILNFIRDNEIENVVFLTTDTHATISNEVFIDFFRDPEPISYEVISGPIATASFEEEVVEFAGPIGLFAFNSVLNLLQLDCRDLDTFSYGLVRFDAAAGTLTVQSKDDQGAVVTDQVNPSVRCEKTFGP